MNFSQHKQAITYDNTAFVQKQVVGEVANIAKTKLEPSSSLIDIGCGTGFLAKELGQNYHILQMDNSDAMLSLAEKYGEVLKEDFDNINIDINRKFDAALSSFAFHWSKDIDNLFVSVKKLLNQNGKFIFAMPIKNSLKNYKYKMDFYSENEVMSALGKYFKVINKEIKNYNFNYDSTLDFAKEIKAIGAFDKSLVALNLSNLKQPININWDVLFITATIL